MRSGAGSVGLVPPWKPAAGGGGQVMFVPRSLFCGSMSGRSVGCWAADGAPPAVAEGR